MVKISYTLLTNPFAERYYYRLDLFNEFSVLGLVYHLYTFSDFNPKEHPRFIMGVSFNILTLFILTINFSLLILSIINETVENCKKRCKKE